MATSNTRVAAYLPSHIEERFNAFKDENGLDNDSKAIIHILASFFGVAHLSGFEVAHSGQYATVERVEALEAKVSELLRLTGESQTKIENAISEVKTEILDELQISLPVNSHSGQLGLLLEERCSESQNSSLPGSPEGFSRGLRHKDLADRLKCDRSTLRKHRDKGLEHFLSWSQAQDPKGIAWKYQNSRYYSELE